MDKSETEFVEQGNNFYINKIAWRGEERRKIKVEQTNLSTSLKSRGNFKSKIL